jgi:hypothetical protein
MTAREGGNRPPCDTTCVAAHRAAWQAQCELSASLARAQAFATEPTPAPTPAPAPPSPPPPAMPPAAADAAVNETARPHSNPHGNGVRIGEARVPAPSAGTGDAVAPSLNALLLARRPARPLDPVLVQLLARLVGHVFGNVTPDERQALDAFCRDWRPTVAPASAPSHAPAPTPADAPVPAPAALAPAPAHAWDSEEWLPIRQVRPAYGVLNRDGSLPTAHADGTPLNDGEWAAQFNNAWYWTDGARLTSAEADGLRAQLVPPATRADRPLRTNLVHQSALWQAIRAQNGMCITHNCQHEAQILANGDAYCCFACHTASALARASGPAVRLAGDAAARATTPAPTPEPLPMPTPIAPPTPAPAPRRPHHRATAPAAPTAPLPQGTPRYKSEPIQPKLMPMNIDVSSRRNVLPCKGINHLVLRPEPPPASQGMVPPRGNGRHNGPGLSQERPVNLPILPFSDPFASGFNNPLKSAA